MLLDLAFGLRRERHQMTTPYHARFFAHELTRQGGDGVDRLSQSLFDACVDLNPHQIEAALFALRSPLSKGVLLADEVGLGKTIEAGLAICQYWAERRGGCLLSARRPSESNGRWNLRKVQPADLCSRCQDLSAVAKEGNPSPFVQDRVVICSLHFASSRATEIKPVPWDLVVIDEAHKLRNAYRPSNEWARTSAGPWRTAGRSCSPPRPCRTRSWNCTGCPRHRRVPVRRPDLLPHQVRQRRR